MPYRMPNASRVKHAFETWFPGPPRIDRGDDIDIETEGSEQSALRWGFARANAGSYNPGWLGFR
jgi:hypothetical protein